MRPILLAEIERLVREFHPDDADSLLRELELMARIVHTAESIRNTWINPSVNISSTGPDGQGLIAHVDMLQMLRGRPCLEIQPVLVNEMDLRAPKTVHAECLLPDSHNIDPGVDRLHFGIVHFSWGVPEGWARRPDGVLYRI